jgi:hypothetical protein
VGLPEVWRNPLKMLDSEKKMKGNASELVVPGE